MQSCMGLFLHFTNNKDGNDEFGKTENQKLRSQEKTARQK